MKKIKIQYLFVAGVLIYLAYYFLAGDGSIKMNSAKAIDKVLKQVEKVDAEKYEIIELQWTEGEKLSNNPRFVNVTLLDKEGKRYSQQFDIFDDKELSFEEIRNIAFNFPGYKAPEYKPLNIKEEIKADEIVAQMNEAIKLLPEELVFQSVYKYQVGKDSETGELERSLVLCVTKKGEKTEVSGRRITTTYYEIPFDIAPDRTVTPKIDEE